jgi:hypothetical protein
MWQSKFVRAGASAMVGAGVLAPLQDATRRTTGRAAASFITVPVI